MSSQEFAQRRRSTQEESVIDVPQAVEQTFAVDSLLDEIDSVLETNAAAFVAGFVQKGGQ
ncbi:MAG: ubiquitin-like protein Pup [Actinomycetaceae bacterium]|nr:ubiquitin-like protein Pup [Actinomycetaceae bacterium]